MVGLWAGRFRLSLRPVDLRFLPAPGTKPAGERARTSRPEADAGRAKLSAALQGGKGRARVKPVSDHWGGAFAPPLTTGRMFHADEAVPWFYPHRASSSDSHHRHSG